MALINFFVFIPAMFVPTKGPAQNYRSKKPQGEKKHQVQQVSLVPWKCQRCWPQMRPTSTVQDVIHPVNESKGWSDRMGSVDPAEVQSCRLEPKKKNKSLQKIDKEEWKD